MDKFYLSPGIAGLMYDKHESVFLSSVGLLF